MRWRFLRCGHGVVALLLACAALGLWSGTALSGTPTLPTVTTPTLPVPVPTVPKLPVPPPPPAVPKVTTPTVTVPAVPLPSTPSAPRSLPTAPSVPSVPGVIAPVSGGLGGNTARGTTPSTPAAPARPTTAGGAPVTHFAAVPRNWVTLTGPPQRRSTVVRFRLARAGRLLFTLEELWPSCRHIATFRARGRHGVNKVRFRARTGAKALQPGTYLLVARRPDGRVVLRVRLVVVRSGTPSRSQLATARQADACAALAAVTELATAPAAAIGRVASGESANLAAPSSGVTRVAAPPAVPRSHPSSGVLGVAKSLSPSPTKAPFLVLALIGLAIILLGIGALPRSAVPAGAVGALIARRRLEIVSAGMATLVASVIAYLLS